MHVSFNDQKNVLVVTHIDSRRRRRLRHRSAYYMNSIFAFGDEKMVLVMLQLVKMDVDSNDFERRATIHQLKGVCWI